MANDTFVTYFTTRPAATVPPSQPDSILLLQSGVVKSIPLADLYSSNIVLIDCTGGVVNTNLLPANSAGAVATRYVKQDGTANAANFIDPSNGLTYTIDIENQSVLLIPIPTLNVWVKG